MITGVSHMKRKLAALLLAMLILFSFPAVQAESPDGEGSMTITLLDRTLTLDYDPDPDFSNLMGGVIQASFYSESEDGGLYEAYVLFPETVKSGDVITTQSSIDAGLTDPGVMVFITDDTLDLYAAACQFSTGPYPSGSRYSIRFDSVVPEGNSCAYSGSLEATLIALDENYKELYAVENVTATFSFTFDFGNELEPREPSAPSTTPTPETPDLPPATQAPNVPNLPSLIAPPDAKKI